MDALILTCGTGGGHNSAAKALAEEFTRRGDRPVILNPYTLCGTHTAERVDKTYISLVQRVPRLFGLIYKLGEVYRRLPFRSPVYFLNKKAAVCMRRYLEHEHFDIVITTHLFPGEIMTWLKSHGFPTPPIIYVATDYTCIPFTEDIDCDAYVVPAMELVKVFAKYGIPESRIHPLGIPVQASFRKPFTCAEAKSILGLDINTDYLLLCGGSMGAGKLVSIVKMLHSQCDNGMRLIVICGSNGKLFKRLQNEYGNEMILLQSTEQMAEYIRASKAYFTKPGGLSSTEAAVISTFLVHLPPIPGCETENARFFACHGMNYPLGMSEEGIAQVLSSVSNVHIREKLLHNQRNTVHADAHAAICDLARSIASCASINKSN